MSLEDVGRRIIETNRAAREKYDRHAARLVDVVANGDWSELDDILDELAPRSGEVPEDSGEAEELGKPNGDGNAGSKRDGTAEEPGG